MAARKALVCASMALASHVAAVDAEACGVGQQECVLADVRGDPGDFVELMQTKMVKTEHAVDQVVQKVQRGRKKQLPDLSSVWTQLKAAVEEDNLKTAIESATDSELVQGMKEKLAQLQESFPSAEELKGQFADNWGVITEAVDLENLEKQAEVAKAKGSEALEKLTPQIEKLKEQMNGVTVESVQERAAGTWADLEEKGFHLPDLDTVSEHAGKVLQPFLEEDGWGSGW